MPKIDNLVKILVVAVTIERVEKISPQGDIL